MNREKFNELDIKGQVNYFNDKLKQENNNFNAICKQIGISKNTILGRFKKEGLAIIREGQKIIGFSKDSEIENVKVEKLVNKNKSKASDPKDINLILKRIELLEEKFKKLESEVIQCNNEHINRERGLDKNFINSYDTTITKTFKIDIEVYQELEKIFNKYKMYKRQDIVSSLLKYALDNI